MATLLYGFEQLADQLQQQLIRVDEDLLISAIEMSSDEHNRQINDLITLFSEDTTDFKTRFESSFPTKNQALDEFGKSLPIKGSLPYETAFPIFTSGNNWGADFITLQKLTVDKFNSRLSAMYEGDARYTRDCILAALFNNTNGGRAYVDPSFGALNIQGLANGDNVQYIITGTDKPATDNHYLFQNHVIDDADNPFGAIWIELFEHPENIGGEIVTFVPQNLEASIEALATFVPVPDIQIVPGANTATLADEIDVFAVKLSRPNVNLPASARVLGRTNKQWIVLWPVLPNNYMLSVVVGTDEPILKRRLDIEETLHGFKPVERKNDFPFFSEQWFRRQGFGGWNRVRACVMQISAAAYAIPNGYDTFEP